MVQFTISGRVADSGGTGISGVVMNGLPGNPSTDVNGDYSATVDYGWSGTVTPQLSGYAFNPPSTTYTNVTSNQTQDYTGTPHYTISGRVATSGGAGISGVVMNGLPGNPGTDGTGNYSAMIDYGWSGTVTPQHAAYNFSPASTDYNNVTSDQTQDYIGTIKTYTLTVNKDGSGTGTVTSNPAGIACGGDCSNVYNSGTVVTLSASPDAGCIFSGWSGGGCSGTGNCQVTMNGNTTVTATFTRQYNLTVNKDGSGTGTVTSSDSGIDCGADCSDVYNSGTVVTLSASPDAGCIFSGWSGGGCSGMGTCQVTMDAAKTVTATFTRQYNLTVNKDGSGTGTVTSIDGGIDCGTDCSDAYNSGTVVTLSASPDAGCIFSGWSGGGCSGTGNCQVTMNDNTTVTATFTRQYTLTVNKDGSGTGTVSSSPAGIACGGDCSEVYDSGTVVTLSASPDAGCIFSGWSGGGCSGTGNCQVTMNNNTTVTATFTRQYTLTVNKDGSGSGTVSSSPAGIDCGADCSEVYNSGTGVSLSANADPGSAFTGWSGDADCVDGKVTMDADKNCTATFLPRYTLTVNLTGPGTGSVTSSPGGIDCGTDCSEVYTMGTVVNLTPNPDVCCLFSGWSGDADCADGQVNVNSNMGCTATFAVKQFNISGHARTASGAAIPGVTMNGLPGNPVTDGAGFYSALVQYGWSGTVRPQKEDYSFSPELLTYAGVAADQDDQDYTGWARVRYMLDVGVEPYGSGTVEGAGILCPDDCDESCDEDSVVTLVAAPASGFVFDYWDGCAAPHNVCDVRMNAEKTVTAHFRLSHLLTVSVQPSVGGEITGDGIACPKDCTEDYPTERVVTLAAQPNQGFDFVLWEGCDIVDGAQCTVSVASEAEVRAIFAQESGASLLYREQRGLFFANWMLYIPYVQVTSGPDVVENYWLLLEYDEAGGYLTVEGYGQLPAGPPTGQVATLQLEDGVWVLRIPECTVEADPDHLYWLVLELAFTDAGPRLMVLEYGAVP